MQVERAKVADLGLAQMPGGLSSRSLLNSQMSGSSHPGTRAYMSPEQENSSTYLKAHLRCVCAGCGFV